MKSIIAKALTIQTVTNSNRLAMNRLAHGLDCMIREHLPHKLNMSNSTSLRLFKPIGVNHDRSTTNSVTNNQPTYQPKTNRK